jgi:hypothetical protein
MLEAQDLVAKNCGYLYVDPINNVEMMEYHIDAVPSENVGSIVGPYGAQLSVKRGASKPIQYIAILQISNTIYCNTSDQQYNILQCFRTSIQYPYF